MSSSLESLVNETVFVDADKRLGSDLFSFLIIGGVSALGFVLLSGFVIGLETGIADWIVSSLCYALFVLPAYMAHRRFSFRSDAPHAHALPAYVTVQLAGIGLAALFSYVAYGVVGLPAFFASTLVIVLTAGVNFMVLKLWAFRQPH
jgi:putative flippase GtrA